MDDGREMTIQDALEKLAQYGFKECTETVRDQCSRACLYAFERLGSDVCYGCETEGDLFVLLSLVEAEAEQFAVPEL
jgi:hypothetical protein